MKVSVRPHPQTMQRTAPSPNNQGSQPADPPESGIKHAFKEVVVGSACASGGLTAGYLMGALNGSLLTNMTAVPVYGQYGTIVGAVTGSLVGTAVYMRNRDDALGAIIKSSAGASVGGTVGLLAGAHFGPALSAMTATAAYGTSGPLAATISGALAGAALTRIGKDDQASDAIKQAAALSVGATTGWMLGGLASHAISSFTSHTFGLGGTLGAISGGAIGLAAYLNADRMMHPGKY